MSHPWATVGHGKGGSYEFFHAEAEIGAEWGHNLPHWRQGGVIYFITFRLADSLPTARVKQLKSERERWLKHHPEPRIPAQLREYHRLFTGRRERWLVEGRGACELKNVAARGELETTFRHLDGKSDGYALDAFVIMPNHVHVLVAPQPTQSLSEIVRTWKSISARRINTLLGRQGKLWQEESWDHIVRSERHLNRYRQYICANPKPLPRPEAKKWRQPGGSAALCRHPAASSWAQTTKYPKLFSSELRCPFDFPPRSPPQKMSAEALPTHIRSQCLAKKCRSGGSLVGRQPSADIAQLCYQSRPPNTQPLPPRWNILLILGHLIKCTE
jgi:REP element-mobilizing transposase RayT